MKKVVLITGTSSGVGLSASIQFAQKGYIVYATMRNLSKQEPLLSEAKKHDVSINLLPLDVSDSKSIETAVKTVIEKESRLDILVNNAGAGFAKSTEQATEKEIEWVMDVNYHGVVRCTKAVLPQMRSQNGGRIINISSVGGLVGQPFNELYCAAKFAVEGYTEAMATYLTKAFGIHFSSVEPGGIATEFMTSAMSKMQETGGIPTDDEYAPILQKYIAGMQERAATGENASYQTPDEVAEVIVEVAENSNPPVRIRTSEWAEDFCFLKTNADPDGTKSVNRVIEKFL